MPNVKFFVDERRYDEMRPKLAALMVPFRESLCRELNVPVTACQLAAIPVLGMDGQPEVNCEIQYLALPERTPDIVGAALQVFRAELTEALGVTPAMRASPLDPDRYVALKM